MRNIINNYHRYSNKYEDNKINIVIILKKRNKISQCLFKSNESNKVFT